MKLQLKLYNEGGTYLTSLSNQITITPYNYNTTVNNAMTPSDSLFGTRYAQLSVIRESGDSFLVPGKFFTTQLRKVSTDAVHVENYLISHDDVLNQNLNTEYSYTSEKHIDTSITQFQFRYYEDEPEECENNDDCPDGEKCVGGECVPCEEQQATHFQIRFEYTELATDSSGSQSMYHLSSIIPIAGAEELIIQGTEINQPTYFPRIRFCDSEGNIKPYTGTLSFHGFSTPDKAWTFSVANGNLTEASTFIGVESQTDAVSNNPWFIPRVLINHIDESAVIYEADCSSVTPQEPPDIS